VSDSTRVKGTLIVVAGVAAGVYLMGVAVVSLHLARYGVGGMGLFQAEYLLAGVMATVPLVIVAFLVAVVVALLQRQMAARVPGGVPRASGSFVKRRDVVVGVLGATIGMLATARFFATFVGHRFAEDVTAPLSVGELTVIGFVVLGFVAALAWGVGLARYARTDDPGDLPYRILGIGLTVVALLGYIGYFTDSLYPRIPAAAGGGAPTAVHLLMTSDSTPGALGSALRGVPAGPVCRHRLLFAGEEAYVIVDPRDSTNGIAVARDLVAAVRTVTGRVEPCAR
jgi:hypothetical protein